MNSEQENIICQFRSSNPWAREFIKVKRVKSENLFSRVCKSICSKKLISNLNNIIGDSCRKWRSRSLHATGWRSRRKSEKVSYRRPKSKRQLRLASSRHPTSELAFQNALNEQMLSSSCSSEIRLETSMSRYRSYLHKNEHFKNQTTSITCHKISRYNENLIKFEEYHPMIWENKLEKCTSEKMTTPNNNSGQNSACKKQASSAMELPVDKSIECNDNPPNKQDSDHKNKENIVLAQKDELNNDVAIAPVNSNYIIPNIQQIRICKPHMTSGQRVNRLVDSESACSIKLVPKLSSTKTEISEFIQTIAFVPGESKTQTLVENKDSNDNYLPLERSTHISEIKESVEELCEEYEDMEVGAGDPSELSDQNFVKTSDQEEFIVEDCDWPSIKAFYVPFDENSSVLKPEGFPRFPLHQKVRKVDNHSLHFGQFEAALRRKIQTEEVKAKQNLRLKHWKIRRTIGVYKKRLGCERFPTIKLNGDLESRFHHIHWFPSGSKSNNVAGRYFDMEENRLVAIKIYGAEPEKLSITQRLESKLAAMREISVLAEIEHCNIVQMLNYFELSGQTHLLLEPCDHSLKSEIEKATKGVHPKMAQGILIQIVHGLQYLHQLHCFHGDLCPENILVTSDGVIKLTDFDKSLFVSNDKRKAHWDLKIGNIAYAAPEILRKLAVVNDTILMADIWSVGCIAVELLRGKPLTNCTSEDEQLMHIKAMFSPDTEDADNIPRAKKVLRAMLPRTSEHIISWILKCLDVDPKRRFPCIIILQHPYFMQENFRDEIGSRQKWESNGMAEGILPRIDWDPFRPRSAPLGLTFTTTTSEINFELLPDEPEQKASVKEIKSKEKKVHGPNDITSSRVLLNPVGVELNPPVKSKSSNRVQTAKINRTRSRDSSKTSKPQLKKSARNIRLTVEKQDTEKTKIPLNRHRSVEVNFLPKKINPPSRSYSKSVENVVPKRVSFVPKSSAPSKLSSKILMQQIIESVTAGNLMNMEDICGHLNKITKTAPKIFTSYRNELMTSILVQVSSPQPKISIGAIRILLALYDIASHYLVEEAERVIAKMLTKIGGTIFTDNICCEILEKVVEHSSPIRCALTLSKVGTTLRSGTGRAAAAKFLCDSIRKMELLEDLGDSTTQQRRLTGLIFQLIIAFNRDTHLPTREYVKELLSILIKHPDFWKLYVEHVKPDQRARVNRVLDDIQKSLRLK